MRDTPWTEGFADEEASPDEPPGSNADIIEASPGDSPASYGLGGRPTEAGIPGAPKRDDACIRGLTPAASFPSEEPYIVTRGKPPRETQFKPGKSGNPKGRPKGTREIVTLLEQELDRMIEVTQQGRTIKLTRRQVIVRRIIEKAMQGEPKAIATCLAVESSKAAKGKAAGATMAEFDAQLSEDDKILQSFLGRGGRDDHE